MYILGFDTAHMDQHFEMWIHIEMWIHVLVFESTELGSDPKPNYRLKIKPSTDPPLNQPTPTSNLDPMLWGPES